MEMKDGLEMNKPSFLAIGRQGYGLGSGDLECQANSSQWPVTEFASTNANSKKIQMDDGGTWHRKSDSWRSFPVESSQAQTWPGAQRAKQQNCNSSIQGCWNAISCNSNNRDVPGSGLNRTSLDSEANISQNASPDLSGCCKAIEIGSGISGFDFLQTGADVSRGSGSSSFLSNWVTGNGSEEEINLSTSALMEDNMTDWRGVAESNSGGVRVADASPSMTCFEDGLGSDGKSTGDFILLQSPDSITGKCFTMDHRNTEVQAPLNRIMNDLHGTVEVETMYSRSSLEDGSALDPSICSYALAISEVEKREASLQAGGLVCSAPNHTGNIRPVLETSGRRSSCKRKLSTSALIDDSSFEGSQISKKRENSSARTGGRSGPSRPNPNPLSGTTSPDSFPSMSATSMIQIWDDLCNDRTGIVGTENDLFESIRSSTQKTSDLHGTGGGAQRTVCHQSGSLRTEQSRSQLHSLFARNSRRSMPTQQLQASLSRRISSAEHVNELSGIGVGITGAPHEFGQRSSTSSGVASWGGNNPLLRGNHMLPSSGVPVRERASTLFEGTRMRGSSGRVPSWMEAATIQNRLASQALTSRGISGMTARATNPLEATVHTNQVENSPFYPGMASSSQLSVFLSNGPGSIDRNVPPATNHPAPFGSSLEVPPPAGSYAGPCPPVTQSSLFLGGQSEGILAGPVRSILGMPFCGLHMVPADGEQRQRFFSEILSALEHSRRSEELSFEELLMLDPSLIYGGIDIHDQHSDMRLDVDNMSYEELLALEERIGDVSTGLSNGTISKCLRESKYSSLDATIAAISEESDIKCCICQEEYVEEDELGRLDCGHGYHTVCISQWLLQKNQCPICKSSAYSS